MIPKFCEIAAPVVAMSSMSAPVATAVRPNVAVASVAAFVSPVRPW